MIWCHLPPVATDSRASVVITKLRTNSSSLTMTVTCFMIPADLSQVAIGNWGLCRTLFDGSLTQSDWRLEYMQYGLDCEMFMIATADDNI